MSGSSARRLAALAVAAGALALLAPGCDLILSIGDEGRPIEEAFQYTCECVELTSQQGRFAERCVEERDALLEQVDSDTASRDLALSLAATGCECAEVESCYGTLTRASAPGETCGDSSDCASWACCATGGVEVVVKSGVGQGERTIAVEAQGGRSCCAPAEPASCSSCADFLAAPTTSPAPELCAESVDLLSALVGCYSPKLTAGTCFDEGCRASTDGFDLAGCLACLLEIEGCQEAFADCQNDFPRPVSP